MESSDPGKGRARKATSLDVAIGERLRAQRLAQRMSEQEFARKLGLTFQQVQNYERGASRISVSRLKRISEILGVPIAAWFSDDALPVETRARQETGTVTQLGVLELLRAHDDDAREFVANARTLRLLKSFAQLSDGKSQALVLELCETLAAKR
jgi:transcriptional regulator with XRE-family HTH domain